MTGLVAHSPKHPVVYGNLSSPDSPTIAWFFADGVAQVCFVESVLMLVAVFDFLVVTLACALNERLQKKLDYAQDEVRVLKQTILALVECGLECTRRFSFPPVDPGPPQWSAPVTPNMVGRVR